MRDVEAIIGDNGSHQATDQDHLLRGAKCIAAHLDKLLDKQRGKVDAMRLVVVGRGGVGDEVVGPVEAHGLLREIQRPGLGSSKDCCS